MKNRSIFTSLSRACSTAAPQSSKPLPESRDISELASMVARCGESRDLSRGKLAHAHVAKLGLSHNLFLGNLLVQMYLKCSSLADACSIFPTRSWWNPHSWTLTITENARRGHLHQALHSYRSMELEGIKSNGITCTTILRICSTLRDTQSLRTGIQLHEKLVSLGVPLDVVAGNMLITLYGRCGEPQRAKQVFDSLQLRDVITWNSMISAFVHTGYGREALDIFHGMKSGGIQPTRVSFVTALGACSSISSLNDGRRIHQMLPEPLNDHIGNALAHMYIKCGSLSEGRAVFDSLSWRHPTTWSSLMGLYTHRSQAGEALKLQPLMDLDGCKPDAVILAKLAEACGCAEDLRRAEELHLRVNSTGFQEDVMVASAQISMFSRCGDLARAREVFDGMPERNVVSWNAMIASLADHGMGKAALQMYRRMEPEGVKPTAITYLHTLGACSSCRDLEEGQQIHSRLKICGYDTHLFIGNALINLYTKCGRLDSARAAFERIEKKDVVSWNVMISAYAQLGHSSEALEIYRGMEAGGLKPTKITLVHALGACLQLQSVEEARRIHEQARSLGLETDTLVGSAIVSAYGRCGHLDEAREVFDRMRVRNVVCWSGFIAALVEHGRGKDALSIFHAMDLDGVKPNSITLLSVLDACASTGAIVQGRKAHERITGCGMDSDVMVGNSLINMYGKCGQLSRARKVFDSMKWRDVVSWTGLLSGYAMNGHSRETRVLFRDMALEGIQPNVITFVSVLFNCSHAGVVKNGLEQFHSMIGDFGVSPVAEHYGCMVDLLGRAGWLEQAEELIQVMPVEPDPATWNSLLSACKVHSHLDRAARLAKQACDLDLASAAYVLLYNIFSSRGGESEQREKDTSLIEVKGRVHEFVSGDSSSHPRVLEIRGELQRLREMIEPGGDAVVNEMHSVTMAIGFGLVASPPGLMLTIVNNRGISPDCHGVAKVISRIAGRQIVVRTPVRVHHFENGVCSCGEFF